MTNNTKTQRAIKKSNVHKGERTISHILELIDPALIESLTSTELATVMDTVNRAYHAGRGSMGGFDVDIGMQALWVPDGINGKEGHFVDFCDL